MEPTETLPAETAPAEAAGAPAAPLMNRNFSLLWTGQTVSQLGNQAFAIAMMFWLMERTGSASLMGLLMTASMLPGTLLGPFGGTFADRHSRIRIVVWSDVLAGLGSGGLAVALWTQPQATRFLIGLLFTVAILVGVVRAFFQPAIAAAIPDLVPKERLTAANSLNQFSLQASLFVGQAAGGVLYALLGPTALFMVDSLSYFFAAGAESLIPRDERRRAETAADVHPFRQFVRETAEGFRWLWAQKGMRDFVLGVSMINFLAMPVTVLFPFYVKLYLHEGAQWYGFLLAAVSIGAVLGFVLAGTLNLAGTARARGVLTAMVLYPVCFSALAFIRTAPLAVVSLLAGGVTLGFINVHLITLLQSATPADLRGRVMGLLGTLGGGLMPLGMALGGVVGDLTDKNVPLVLLVSAAIALLVTIGLAVRRPCREFLAAD
jgi:DHA3 family macrolide efflux protein-like MFS transporter